MYFTKIETSIFYLVAKRKNNLSDLIYAYRNFSAARSGKIRSPNCFWIFLGALRKKSTTNSELKARIILL